MMPKVKSKLMRGALALSTSLLGLTTEAYAQTPQDRNPSSPQPAASGTEMDIADIIVTAQKRSTTLQKTPLAVTALNAEALQQAQVHGIEDINGLVPSLKIGDSTGYPQITVRGIGINNFVPLAESAVALNVNEVYVSRPVAFLGGFYDVSDLEVLRGPQGTLYGRNATAGAINLTTARPTDDLSGYGTVTGGNYGRVRAEGAIGGALVQDKVLVRIAAFRESRKGFGRNITNGDDVDDYDGYGMRGTLVLKPTSELTATIIAEYNHENDNSGGGHFFGTPGPISPFAPPPSIALGAVGPSDRRDLANALDPIFKLRTTAITGIVEWSKGPFSVKSITGYRDQNSFNRANLVGGDPGAYFLSGEPAHQLSQELQLHYDTSSMHLTGGGYYFRETDTASPATIIANNAVVDFTRALLAFPGPGPASIGPGYTVVDITEATQHVRAAAVFGEATFNVTEQLSLTAGARYSTERKQLDNRYYDNSLFFGPIVPYTGNFVNAPTTSTTVLPSRTFNSFTPKLGIQYQANAATMLYVSYSKGFKSGGFSAGASDAVAGAGFRPEKLTDFEGGIKTKLFDNRLRLNLAGFYYKYKDLQVQTVDFVANSLLTVNAGKAKVYGVEGEFTALLTDAFTVDGNFSAQHARYTEYTGLDNTGLTPGFPPPPLNYKGKALNNAPDFSGLVGATYKLSLPGGTLSLRGEVEHSSRFFFDPTNIATTSQPAFTKENAFLTYMSNSGWHVRAFMRNISNKETITAEHLTGSPFLGHIITGSLAQPRTYGLDVGYAF